MRERVLPKKVPILALLVFFFYFLTLDFTLSENCALKLQESFLQACLSKKFYVKNKCHRNVYGLYHFLKEKNPTLAPNDFRVVIISTKAWLYEESAVYFVAKKTKTENVEWKYHVLLENQGLIYDVDYFPASLPIEKKKYFYHMLSSRDKMKKIRGDLYQKELDPSRDELFAYIIPGNLYLTEAVQNLKIRSILKEIDEKKIPLVSAKEYFLNH